jgi:beta-barrel assembly-enhancing protease
VPEHSRCSDPRCLAALSQIVERLSEPLTTNPYNYRIVVSRDPRVNAFAAPGGYIVLFQGLLETTKTPEQLAGVLAHEMQHVLQRHSTKAIFREASLYALLAVLAGDRNASSVAVQCAAILGRLHHSRQDEEAADREAMRMLQKARVDPAGMLEFLAFMETQPDSERMVPAYLSTHPPTQERIARLQKMAASSSYIPERLLSGRCWSEVLIPCGFIGQRSLKRSA